MATIVTFSFELMPFATPRYTKPNAPLPIKWPTVRLKQKKKISYIINTVGYLPFSILLQYLLMLFELIYQKVKFLILAKVDCYIHSKFSYLL